MDNRSNRLKWLSFYVLLELIYLTRSGLVELSKKSDYKFFA